MQKITTYLWFDDQAEEAANFYVSLFKNSKIKDIKYYGDAGRESTERDKGSVMTVTFELDGQEFIALNGGPQFKFNEAISLYINCEDQEEVDHFWNNLTAVPEAEQCGWLIDKFGVSWQVVPTVLSKLLSDPDKEKLQRVTEAMLSMKKMSIKGLKEAYGKS